MERSVFAVWYAEGIQDRIWLRQIFLDLSDPSGGSVNDGVDPTLCSLSYKTVDDAVKMIVQKGRGTLLAKLNLENAYCIVPVHPDDRPLLSMEWEGQLYVDAALHFGLRSSPRIFNALADGLMWIMKQRGIKAVNHYPDDSRSFWGRMITLSTTAKELHRSPHSTERWMPVRPAVVVSLTCRVERSADADMHFKATPFRYSVVRCFRHLGLWGLV